MEKVVRINKVYESFSTQTTHVSGQPGRNAVYFVILCLKGEAVPHLTFWLWFRLSVFFSHAIYLENNNNDNKMLKMM